MKETAEGLKKKHLVFSHVSELAKSDEWLNKMVVLSNYM